jgi:8-oxo-dGTP diphosphatase
MTIVSDKSILQEIIVSGFNAQTHGSVGVAVRNSEGKYLILQRSLADEDGAGLYDIPGGTPDFEHEIEEAAIRELSEEAGINAETLEFFAHDHYICPWNNEKKMFFMFSHIIGKGEDAILSFEHESYAWIDPSELDQYEFYKENAKQILKAHMEHQAEKVAA